MTGGSCILILHTCIGKQVTELCPNTDKDDQIDATGTVSKGIWL